MWACFVIQKSDRSDQNFKYQKKNFIFFSFRSNGKAIFNGGQCKRDISLAFPGLEPKATKPVATVGFYLSIQ